MRSCSVQGCTNEDLRRFYFPKDERLRQVWLNRVKNSNLKNNANLSKSYVICGLHFADLCFQGNGKLKKFAVPTLHLPDFHVDEQSEEWCFSYKPIEQPCSVTPPKIKEALRQPTASSAVMDEEDLKLNPPEKSYSSLKRKTTLNLDFPTEQMAEEILSSVPTTSSTQVSSPLPIATQVMSSAVTGSQKSKPRFVNLENSSDAKLVQSLKSIKRLLSSPRTRKLNMSGRIKIIQKNLHLLKYLRGVNETTLNFFISQCKNQALQPRGRRFSITDKALALSLYKRSGKAYRFLSTIFSLPSRKTLSQILNKIPFVAGINTPIFENLKIQVNKLKNSDKYCVLMFDEISLDAGLGYNKKYDFIEGFIDFGGTDRKIVFADHALVFMVKTIHKGWKQPVAFTFCHGTTPTIDLVRLLKEIIKKIRETGLNIVASICDQGATNSAAINYLLKETNEYCLKENLENRFQGYLVDGKEIVHLYDCPHLLNGVRNSFVIKDLQFQQDGKAKVASWLHILRLYEIDRRQGPYLQLYKITDEHVMLNKIRKMKVKMASQIFSYTVGTAMYSRAVISKELPSTSALYLDPKATETADLILFFDKLFDSVNGSSICPPTGKPLRCVVKENSPHVPFWQSALPVLESMYFISQQSRTRIPSLKNWIFTLRGFIYLSKRLLPELKYFPTRSFNQDPVENFFSQIRSHAMRNPTCSSFINSFKSLLINNFSSSRSVGSNCEEDESSGPLHNVKEFIGKQVTVTTPNPLQAFNVMPTKNFATTVLHDFATPYVAGAIGRKLFKKLSCSSCRELLISIQELPENLYIELREYNTLQNKLIHPSSRFSVDIKKITYIILDVVPQIILTFNIKATINDHIFNLGICQNMLCKDHQMYVKPFINIITSIVLFHYIKILNNLLKHRDTRYKNLDTLCQLAFSTGLKKRRQ